MFAPTKDLAEVDAGVIAVLGSNAERLYSFGEAPATVDPVLGYAVWQVVAGSPENLLAGRPQEDLYVVQVDTYAKAATRTKEIAKSLVHCYELAGEITGWNGEFIDPDTKLRRISFTVEFITPR